MLNFSASKRLATIATSKSATATLLATSVVHSCDSSCCYVQAVNCAIMGLLQMTSVVGGRKFQIVLGSTSCC